MSENEVGGKNLVLGPPSVAQEGCDGVGGLVTVR